MAIYISGVRGLPEQVQKNKDDIKDLQDLTATQGGDLEAEINNRKALIDNGEANISVINVPDDSNSFVINCVDSNNVSHTLLYDADLNRVYADNKELALKEDLDTEVNTRKALIDNGEANISVINVPDDTNSFVINCKDNNNVSHTLMFDADLQTLTIDGNPVVPHLYANNIEITGENENNDNFYVYLTIYADKILTNLEIENYIKQFGGGANSRLQASGYCVDGYSINSIMYTNNKYWYNDNNDSSMEIITIDTILNKAIQIL